MAHVRTQIRAAVAALLVDIPAIGGRCHINRVLPVEEEATPYLSINTEDEEVRRLSPRRPAPQERDVTVTVQIVVSDDTPEETVDALLAAVETRLTDARLGGIAQDFQMVAVTPVATPDTAPETTSLIVSYRCRYVTLTGAPETAA